MAKNKTKQNKEFGVGSIIALVIAGLVIIGILAGVVLYVHSGRAGISQSAGLITGVETQVAGENGESQSFCRSQVELSIRLVEYSIIIIFSFSFGFFKQAFSST